MPCKHIYAVEFVIQREEWSGDGPTFNPAAAPSTPSRDWSAYNRAQTNEQRHFATLLRELCDTVPQPPQSTGRPRLPIGDMILGIGLKVYSTMSGRRAMTDVRDAHAKGLLQRAPSAASIFRSMEHPDLTPLLRSLIEQSALPLRAVEVDFAPDSSGFSSSVYHRWFDHKWGRELREAHWVKAHVMCGVKTNIVTAADATITQTADSPYFVSFVETTARNFNINEVAADKAYLSKKNLRAVEAAGGTAYIPFKTNSVGSNPKQKRDTVWEQAFHFYNFHRAEFLAHYHKRSNVESTFSMIKAKFGGAVRSKAPVAQANEVLTKILCHNICVLIQSMYELEITPVFGLDASEADELGNL